MRPVPRKAGKPLTLDGSRAVLCSSCPGKVYASTLRAAAVPWLEQSVGEAQVGAVRGRGIDFAIFEIRLFSELAKQQRRSAAVLFADLRKAFYSVLVESALGPLMLRSERARLLEARGRRALEGEPATTITSVHLARGRA